MNNIDHVFDILKGTVILSKDNKKGITTVVVHWTGLYWTKTLLVGSVRALGSTTYTCMMNVSKF